MFHEDRSLWRVVEGRFEFRLDGSMAITSDTLRYALDHSLPLGEHFEVEFENGKEVHPGTIKMGRDFMGQLLWCGV